MSASELEPRESKRAHAERVSAPSTAVRAGSHAHAGAPDGTWVLDDEALTLETRDGSRERIELGELAELRLVHAPTRAARGRFECRLRTRDGRKRAIVSHVEPGRAADASGRAEYTAFVRALVDALVVRAPQCRFRAAASGGPFGVDVGRAWFWLVLLVVVIVALAALGTPPEWAHFGLVLMLVLAPSAILWANHDRPREFDPRRIPGELLPGG